MECKSIKHNLMSDYITLDGTQRTKEHLQIEKIKASEKLRIDINREEDPFKMLDAALLCISFLTGDNIFYSHNKTKVVDYICNQNN